MASVETKRADIVLEFETRGSAGAQASALRRVHRVAGGLEPRAMHVHMSICHRHFQSENLTERQEIAIAHDLSIYGVLHTKF